MNQQNIKQTIKQKTKNIYNEFEFIIFLKSLCSKVTH